MKAVIFLLHLAVIPLFAQEGTSPTSFFEIPFKKGVQYDASRLNGLFSSDVLKVRNAMKAQDLVNAFPAVDFGRPDTMMSGKLAGNSYLDRIRFYFENGKLQNFSLSAMRLPPGKDRFLSWLLEIERLIGPPTVAFRDLSGGGPDERTLMLVWSPNPNALTLRLEADGDDLEMDLGYYPGPANPGLKRVAAIKRHPVAFQSLQILLGEFVTRARIFPEGDAAVPVLKVPEGESNLLREYSNQSILNLADMSRDEAEVMLPLLKKIEEALDKHYAKMSDKEKWERLCLITEDKVPGFGSGEIQVGAARFLARHDGPNVLPYLFRGLKVELPGGVADSCEAGIAKRCDDVLFDQLLEMESKGQLPRENLAGIFMSMPGKRHLEMLVRKRDKLTGDHREMVDGTISMLKQYKLLD